MCYPDFTAKVTGDGTDFDVGAEMRPLDYFWSRLCHLQRLSPKPEQKQFVLYSMHAHFSTPVVHRASQKTSN